MRAMILAAGLGTRLRPLTWVRPKVLVPVMGMPLLDYWMWQFEKSGFEAVIINAYHLPEKLVAAVRGRNWPLPVKVSVEQDLLGTAGGIRNVLDFFGFEPFVVVNGDVICKVDFIQLYERHLQSKSAVSMLLHDWPAFNNVAVDRNSVCGFGREAHKIVQEDPQERLLAFTGIQIINPSVLSHLPVGQAGEIIPLYRQLIAAGEAPHAIVIDGLFWREIGSIEAYRAVHMDLSMLPETSLLPIQTGKKIVIHPQAEVSDQAELRGMISIGQNTCVHKDVLLENVILWDHVAVRQNTCLRNCIVADGMDVEGIHQNEILCETNQ